jgi:hypothetical protein
MKKDKGFCYLSKKFVNLQIWYFRGQMSNSWFRMCGRQCDGPHVWVQIKQVSGAPILSLDPIAYHGHARYY